MENEKFNVKVVGIVFSPSTRKILLGKGKDDEFHTFIEDSLNKDEELDVRLKKAVKDKTGYVVSNLGAVFARNNMAKDKEALKLYFLCEFTGGEEKLAEHVESLTWASPRDVEEMLGEKLPTRLKEYITNLG